MLQKLVRLEGVIAVSGHPSSTLYRKVSEGLFPKPINISERAVAWLETELAAWQDAKIAGKTDAEIKALVAEMVAARSSHREAA